MDRWITTHVLRLDALLADTATPDAGALVVFDGTVRNEHEGRSVRGMTYDAHIGLAASTLQALEVEVLERFDVLACRIQHRIGGLDLGETSVYVVVRSAHRDAAFQAARYAIDTLKVRTPIWKLEHYTDAEDAWLKGVPLQEGPS